MHCHPLHRAAPILTLAVVCILSLVGVPALAQESGEADVVEQESHEAEDGDSHEHDSDHDAGHDGEHGEHHVDVDDLMDQNAGLKGLPLAFWTGVTFVVFLIVLSRVAWGPMVTALDQREQRIRDDIAAAESARVKSEQMLADHEKKLDAVQDEVKEILAEARRDAETAKSNIMAEAQSEAEAARRRAETDIERAKDQALKELFDRLNDRVVDMSGYVLGRSMDDADHRKLIDEALVSFEANGPTKA
ncbi:F0F1 ATP synthase subunit B [Stratiformator vulcanicus]|nr:F0F1 ATP synthase subunit B [Stratiformator vulcanicus]